MALMFYGIYRMKGDKKEFYADEEPGTDDPKWVDMEKEAWAESEGIARGVLRELERAGYGPLFIEIIMIELGKD